MAGYSALKKKDNGAVRSAKGSSFYVAMRIMPPSQRHAMYEIYRYCRTIDDIGDEQGSNSQKLAQLGQWRSDIAALFAGNPPAALQGLAKAVTDFGLREQDFIAIIDGVEMDARGPVQAPELAVLTLYCDRVACAVGRLSVRVFGMQEEQGHALAHHLGMALQLTNILRDIDEDAQLDRLYLPREFLQGAGIGDICPQQVVTHASLPAVCYKVVDLAHAHFVKASDIMKQCDSKQVRTPYVMYQAYRGLFVALIDRGFAFPRRPVRISKITLSYLLARNLLF
jgi:phytoene synthase